MPWYRWENIVALARWDSLEGSKKSCSSITSSKSAPSRLPSSGKPGGLNKVFWSYGMRRSPWRDARETRGGGRFGGTLNVPLLSSQTHHIVPLTCCTLLLSLPICLNYYSLNPLVFISFVSILFFDCNILSQNNLMHLIRLLLTNQ